MSRYQQIHPDANPTQLIGADSLTQESESRPIIVMIADGWSRSNFIKLLSRGDLPEVHQHLIGEGGFIPEVVSNIPSVSIASHASILTGAFQDQHMIPGHRWFDTASGECHDYLRIRGPQNVNSALSTNVKTIFEQYPDRRGISVQSVVRRGADSHFNALSLGSRVVLDRLGDEILKHPHSVAVGWLPRVDSLSHVYGPQDRRVLDDMRSTSRNIGRLTRRLASAGLLEGSRILLVPDHGQREVKSRTPLDRLLGAVGVNAVVNPRSSRGLSSESIAMTSGDSSAMVYLRGDDALRNRSQVAKEVARTPGVSLVCVRRNNDHAEIHSPKGSALASIVTDGKIRYEVTEGFDPLELLKSERSAFYDVSEPIGMDSPYPDFLNQYFHSTVPARSSDLLVFAAADTHFGNGPRFGWRFGFHRGTHGGPHAEEVVVAAAFRGPVRLTPTPTRLARIGVVSGMMRESFSGLDENDGVTAL